MINVLMLVHVLHYPIIAIFFRPITNLQIIFVNKLLQIRTMHIRNRPQITSHIFHKNSTSNISKCNGAYSHEESARSECIQHSQACYSLLDVN